MLPILHLRGGAPGRTGVWVAHEPSTTMGYKLSMASYGFIYWYILVYKVYNDGCYTVKTHFVSKGSRLKGHGRWLMHRQTSVAQCIIDSGLYFNSRERIKLPITVHNHLLDPSAIVANENTIIIVGHQAPSLNTISNHQQPLIEQYLRTSFTIKCAISNHQFATK